jgi:hypothetical protein
MAARRLIIVMVVLLGVSTVIAMITPQPESPDSGRGGAITGASGVTGTTAAPGTGGSAGAIGTGGPSGITGATGSGEKPRAVDPGQQPDPGGTGSVADKAGGAGPLPKPGVPVVATIGAGGSPATVRALPGSRVVLTVETEETTEVEIPELGRIETATRFAPARFDLVLPPGPGSYPVRDLESGRIRATIESRDYSTESG